MKLSELTDFYSGEPGPVTLPVQEPFPELKKVYITGEPVKEVELPSSNIVEKLIKTLSETQFSQGGEGFNNVFGLDDKPRYQLWPERLIREGATAAGEVAQGKVPLWSIDKDTGDVHTSPQMIEKAQQVSALAGTGGLAGAGGSLNATPSLRPALKYNGKLYKGKPGQEHMDVIPADIYPTFQKQAMSGEDISNFNFGFINDKGHFLSREDALKYGIDNGLIDPHAGKYGALTSTLMSDSSKPGVAIEAMKPAFYSAVEHQVSAIPQAKMTGEQWLGTLSNKPGVKGEELQWTGLADFLAENKGKPVTKAQIEEHLAANKVELKEVTKGTANPEAIAAKQAFDAYGEELAAKYDLNPLQNLAMYRKMKGMSDEEVDKYTRLQQTYHDLNEAPKTKYHSYQLPGGENYREMLLTLPINKMAYAKKAAGAAWEKMTPEQQIEFANKPIKGSADLGTYRSSHWDEPNILAHVRMNDRTIDGKKSLHLEEIQSDWHQQGRDKGYRPEQEKKLANLVKQREDLQKEASVLSASDARYKEIYKELPTIQTKINEIGSGNVGVPDAPFKKTWHELALKRMLREAAEKGYDRLSWTPGEAQAARYDLSKSISDLSYNPRTKTLVANDKNGSTVMQQKGVEPDKISDFVGKDVAKKLMETKYDASNPYSLHSLTNTDLKIGGEGMKGFYDQIIPKSLEKLGKEHGVKVKKEDLIKGNPSKDYDDFINTMRKDLRKEFYDDAIKEGFAPDKAARFADKHTAGETWNLAKAAGKEKELDQKFKAKLEFEKTGNQPVYYIDIPQSLKDTATQKGFPLFAKGGYMLQPVDYEPEFKK